MNKKFIVLVLCIVVILSLSACSNKAEDEIGSVQNTLFKVTNENGELLKSSSLNIKGANVSGENGKFKAPLNTKNSYNIKMKAERFEDKTDKYKPQKGNSVVTYKMNRNKFDFTGAVKSNDKPVKGATVKIENTNKSDTTDDQGVYEFKNVPSKKYNMTISRQGFSDKSFEYDVCKENLGNGDENNNISEKVDIEIEMDSLPTVVKGRLVDNKDNPLTNKSRKVKKIDKKITTDSDGNFETELNEGNYTFVFDYSNFKKKMFNFDIPAGVTKNLGNISLQLPNGDIKGVVKNNVDGNLLDNITIKLLETGDITTTNEDGEFSFNELKPKTYSLDLSHNDFGDRTVPITVESNKTNEKIIKLSAHPGSLIGSTQPNADVSLQETGDSTTAENNGSFEFGGLVEGSYTLEITHDHYKLDDSTDTSFEIIKNKITDIGEINLKPKDDGIVHVNISNNEIDFVNDDEINIDFVKASYSFNKDLNNEYFKVKELPVGEYEIEISHNNYVTKTVPVTIKPTHNDSNIVDLNIELEPKPGMVQGIVSNNNSNPIENATVKVIDNSLLTVTNNVGGFSFDNLPVGDYEIEISHNDYVTKTESITITKDSTLNKDITLNGKPGNITGTTQPNATVSINELSDSKYNDIDVSSTGSFRIDDIEPGDYILNVNHSDYNSKSVNFTVYRNETNSIGSITLEPKPGSITGNINKSNNLSDFEGVTVTIDGQTDTTDSNGNFSISNLSPGYYSVKIEKSGFINETIESVEVKPNKTTTIDDVFLKEQASGEGNLNVYLESTDGGTPIGDITIKELGQEVNGSSAPFNNIKEGNYNISVTNADGYYNTTESITVLSDETTNLTITLTETAPMIHGAIEGNVKYANNIDVKYINELNVTVVEPNDLTSTNSSGYYKIEGLTEDNYTVEFRKNGKKYSTVDNVYVSAGESTTVNQTYGYVPNDGFDTVGYYEDDPHRWYSETFNDIKLKTNTINWEVSYAENNKDNGKVQDVKVYMKVYDTNGNLILSKSKYIGDMYHGSFWVNEETGSYSYPATKVGKIKYKVTDNSHLNDYDLKYRLWLTGE